MRARSIQKTAIACLILAASAGVAVAQPAAEGAKEEPAAEPTEGTASQNPEETLNKAHATLDKMEAIGDNISRMLRSSRQDKDVVKILCLDDKSNQMNVATRSAASRVANIESAVQSKKYDRIDYDYEVLGALSEHGDELAVEANQCIGEEGGGVDETQLEVTIDPAIPREDTTDPGGSSLISAAPAAASPTI